MMIQKKVEKFIFNKGYSQLTEAPKDLLSNSLPTTYIFNKEGEIVDKTGDADWNSDKVRSLLDKLIVN